MGRLRRPGWLGAPAAAILVAVAVGCGPARGVIARPDVGGRRIRAVATTGMVADVVANVGGRRIDVTALMGPGVDPHLYKASERDVIALAEADIVFYSGLHLEAKMADVFFEMRHFARTVAVTDAIDRAKLLAPPEFEGAYDPHVWFDVHLWATTIGEVADALIELDPAKESLYRDNARRYTARLRALDRYVEATAATIPDDKRVLITAHDAFKYFGRAYGFRVKGLQGISTATEAGTADVSAIASFIAARRIPAIFVESSVPSRFIQAVEEAVAARDFDVEIGGSLYSDAMGTAGTFEGTYVGMVRHNIDTIAAGLRSGDVSARRVDEAVAHG